jgi:hypothetical protein
MRAAREVVAPVSPARLLAALAFAGLLGCVHQPTPPAPPAAAPAPSRPGASAPLSPPPAGAAPAQPPAAPSPPARGAAGTPAPAAPPRRPLPAAAPAAGAAPASAARSAPPPLDLASLEQRLRETRAIGVFTKLSLKNQVDDLLAQFRAFYAGQGTPTLAELRRSYELLLLKVATLLQDGDPALASAVSSSREAIWAILSNRTRFNNL